MKTKSVAACVLGLAGIVSVPAPAATHHHHTASRHTTSHHSTSSRHGSHGTTSRHTESSHHGKPAKPAAHHEDVAPKGVTTVPAGGVKLFCGPGRNPLMVRKMTQGAGTTVTVICR